MFKVCMMFGGLCVPQTVLVDNGWCCQVDLRHIMNQEPPGKNCKFRDDFIFLPWLIVSGFFQLFTQFWTHRLMTTPIQVGLRTDFL